MCAHWRSIHIYYSNFCREKINVILLQENKQTYNQLVDKVKIIDADHCELHQFNREVAEKLEIGTKKLELMKEEKAVLKSQFEKCINEVVEIPIGEREKLVSRLCL